MEINGSSEVFAIIGNPVHHSLSPVMHNPALRAMGYNGVYIPLEVADLAAAMAGMKAMNFKGCSVTIPHKEKIIGLIDEVEPEATQMGAVNTVKFSKEGNRIITKGFNTDWLGSNLALADHLDLDASKIVVLGAGGAARGVCFGLKKAGAEVIIVNRTEEKARNLAELLECQWATQQELGEIKADGLVNTTSVGMTPNIDDIPISEELIKNYSLIMDIVYAPLETKLLRVAKQNNIKTIDGLAMLLYQAAAQLEIWTGKKPPVDIMRKALTDKLMTP